MHGMSCCGRGHGSLRLDMLNPGESATVVEIRGGGPFLRRRLLEMGILKGTTFKVQRVAPLGDPMEIRLKGSSVSLRMREAHHIIVEKEGGKQGGKDARK